MREKHQALLADRIQLLGSIKHEDVRDVNFSQILIAHIRADHRDTAARARPYISEPILDRGIRYWHPGSSLCRPLRRQYPSWRSPRDLARWNDRVLRACVRW